MMKPNKLEIITNRKSGFTLIELLVVVAIIGILASVVLTSLNSARSKGRDARRHSDIHQIQNALALYYSTNGAYPVGAWWQSNSSTGWNAFQTLLSPYISSLPHDPVETATGYPFSAGVYTYGFYSTSYGCSGQWYMLVYQLETAKGPDPGVTACNGYFFQYGGSGANTAIKTVGSNGYPY